ncbi:hypothetical protein AN641_04565 [Candidatus Epulonipiscioides gigas]|nr:hypothetical protein AN641_04565 [Epulopiscium sp. SCG-C07WGA-EpuloA2]
MKTTSIGILNLCAPCKCACKYCLLKSQKKGQGIDYIRGEKFAQKMINWAKEKNIAPIPYYYIGFCADYPELLRNILFNKSNEWTGASFLQCNGINIRNSEEINEFLTSIKSVGVNTIDISFFGNKDYHDLFAARKGDYDFMLSLATKATELGIICNPSITVTKESLPMLDDLYDTLYSIPKMGEIGAFLPDYRGRGYLLEHSRITVTDYENLSEKVKKTLNISNYKTQQEWLDLNIMFTHREITIALKEDNIDMLEQMNYDEIISYAEKLDDDYHRIFPSFKELSKKYGEKCDDRLYQYRDLVWKWQNAYIKENNLKVYDITDDTNISSVRWI